jgi:hypothetical protein
VRVLSFTPNSAIWRHTLLENHLLKILENNRNFEILSVGCGGVFTSDCTPRQYLRGLLSKEEQNSDESCQRCQYLGELDFSKRKGKKLFLKDFICEEDAETIDLAEIGNQDIRDVIFKEIPIGRLAVFETILRHKKRSFTFDEIQIQEIRASLSNCIKTILAAERILEMYQPDCILVHNAQYAVTGAFAEAARTKGVKVYQVSGSPSPAEFSNSIRIWDWEKYKAVDPALNWWSSERPVYKPEKRELKRLKNHFRVVKSANSVWTYTSSAQNSNPFTFFEIEPEKKIIVTAMNSEDEIYAARTRQIFPLNRTDSPVFTSQVEWVQSLINFVKFREDVALIIRIHPREYPNKREKVLSEQAPVWEKLFEDLPRNVRIDHPDLEYSLYDYFDHITCLTTGWSSAGLEALNAGIPVVVYDQNLLGYPHDRIFTGSTSEKYFENIEAALKSDRDDTQKEYVAHWLAASLFKGSISLGGGLQDLHLRFSNRLLRWLCRGLNRSVNKLFKSRVKNLDLRVPINRKDEKLLAKLLLSKSDSLFDLI